MSVLNTMFLVAAVSGASWWLTGRFRRYALRRQLLDIPNPRSSHAVATPRGGGIAIVLASVPVIALCGAVNRPQTIGLIGAGVLASLIGFMDDHRHVPPAWRLSLHFVAAAWIVAWIGGLPPLPMVGFVPLTGWVGYALTALYIVWLLNLTNFMDGIDGIAAVEAITVCLGGVLLYFISARSSTDWVAPMVVASATLGFLVWNWPPAKIFMGDAGSGFLGITLAAFSLQARSVAPELYWGWLILLGVFVVDATITLLRRLAHRDRVHEAHRTHAYQHAALRWAAHRPVTITIGVINVCWLLPLAVLVASGRLSGLLGLFIAYTPLCATAWWLKAGCSESAHTPYGCVISS